MLKYDIFSIPKWIFHLLEKHQILQLVYLTLLQISWGVMISESACTDSGDGWLHIWARAKSKEKLRREAEGEGLQLHKQVPITQEVAFLSSSAE